MSIKESHEEIYKGGIVDTIKRWYDDSKGDIDTWQRQQDKWHRLRMRIKKSKTKPFVGCSNMRMPTLDTKIRKLKASIINGVFGVRPVVQVIPTPGGDSDTAIKIEKFLDHMIMDVIGVKKKAVIAVDQELEKGFYLLKPFWNVEVVSRSKDWSIEDLSEEELRVLYDPETPRELILQAMAKYFEIDESQLVAKENAKELIRVVKEILDGADNVTGTFRDVIKNNPDVALASPERVFVPGSSGYDPQSCQYIIHEFFITYEQLMQNVNNKDWSKAALEKIDFSKDYDLTDTDVTKDMREGIQRLKREGLIKVWECYCYYDVNGDGVSEKAIVTMCPDFDVEFRTIELPFYSNRFPFIKLFYELTDDRWFSHRGLPELIEDIVKEIDIQHMQRIDTQTLRNSPMFLYRAGQVKGKTKQFGFARGIPVSGMQQLKDIIAPFNSTNTNAEYSYKDEMQILGGAIDELIGQIDFNLQSQINRRQPRTEGEVEMHVANSNLVASLDADLHREQFGELFSWIWELWCQFGNDQYEFNYFGPDGIEPIRLNREDVQNKYKIVVRANDNNTNPEVRQRKAGLILQDTYAAFQMGLASPQAVLEARKRAMQEMDVCDFEKFLTPPPPPEKPQTPVQPVVVQMEDLTDSERAQVLASIGIKPDKGGRFIEKVKREEQQQFENVVEVAKNMSKGE